MSAPEERQDVRSSVKIEQNTKGAFLKVSIYEGTTEEEAQRIKDLAMRTFEVGLRELAQMLSGAR